jgi:hypothetical protein
MCDVHGVIRTLDDVLRHAELSEGNREALTWAIAELQTPPSGSPWRAERGQILNAEGWVIASVPYTLGGLGDDANRRLILGAPVLLEACRRAIHELMPGADIPAKAAELVRTTLQEAVYLAESGAAPFWKEKDGGEQ